MLHERTTQYHEHWKSKGRQPPIEDEWYEIAETEVDEAGRSAGGWLDVVKDENGVALSGPVKTWPFEGIGKCRIPLNFNDIVLTFIVPSSFLEGKPFPPKAAPKAQ